MRHRIKGRKLGRTASHRTATLRSLATALIKHKKITTTVAKAKQTRLFVEPLITKAKKDLVHTRRLVAQHIHDKEVLKELFGDVIAKIGDRPGGYTRVVKLGNRVGDAAEMAILELVDYNDLAPTKKSKKKVKADKTEKVAEKDAPEIEDAEIVEEEVAETEVEENEEVAVEADPEESKTEKTEESSSDNKDQDDLTKIEGIGPKIAEILKSAEIDSFKKLSKTDVEKLNEILAEAGGRYCHRASPRLRRGPLRRA